MTYFQLSFTDSDQASFLAGDTIGYTWTGYGAIPYDGSYEYNYCDDSVGQPEVGGQFSLVAGRYGNRQYSISAIIKPAVGELKQFSLNLCTINKWLKYSLNLFIIVYIFVKLN